MKTPKRIDSRRGAATIRRAGLALLVLGCYCCNWPRLASAQDEATAPTATTTTTATTSTTTTQAPEHTGGLYVEASENILTPQGEVALDPESGARLPEETNDGELEGGDRHTEWTYADQTKWAGEYPQCKGANMRQSPIDILTDKVVFNARMRMELIDYAQAVEFEARNTQHSVSLVPIPSIAPPTLRLSWITGSGEGGKEGELYELQEVHFHWGDGVHKGSEHEINDQRAAAEMHMVHYRKGIDKSKLGSVENSVVVIGVFIESDAVEHNTLEALVARAGYVNGTNAQYKDGNPENLMNLLPENHHSFYTYNGSLTTPPCYEVVTWILLSEPVYMSEDKLSRLANLECLGPDGKSRRKIRKNNRDIQPLLNRPVYVSFNTTDSESLDRDLIGKRIGSRNGTLARALNEYWTGVNKLRVSMREAYKSIGRARKRLLTRLGLKRNAQGKLIQDPAANATDAATH